MAERLIKAWLRRWRGGYYRRCRMPGCWRGLVYDGLCATCWRAESQAIRAGRLVDQALGRLRDADPTAALFAEELARALAGPDRGGDGGEPHAGDGRGGDE